MTIWPYQTIGNPANPPLVFLHGFMGRGSDWLPVSKRLAGQYYCLMPDLPGHGDNINLPLFDLLTFDTVVSDFMRWLDYLALESINLVGYSMGGRLALYTATKFPARVTSLMLESASPGLADTQARRARAKVDDERAQMLLRVGIDSFVDHWYETGLFNSLKQHPGLLEQTKIVRKQNNPRWAAKVIKELSPGRQLPLWNKLSDLPMPILLMAGALDAKYVERTHKMGSLISHATVKIIPNAGHIIHLEQPDTFTAALNSQLLATRSPDGQKKCR